MTDRKTPESLAAILLVDDEAPVRRLFATGLKRAGHPVYEACNGVEALEIYDRHPQGIELVITDVRMPLMGGRELIEHLRARRPAIPIICISGYAGQLEFDAGVDFLAKPVSRDDLLKKVREVLARAV